MAQRPVSTVYANVINLRVTPGEMVLDFGAHFPDQPNQPPPGDFQPDVRVVMSKNVLPGLIQVLQQAAGAVAPPKAPPGFRGGPPPPPPKTGPGEGDKQ